MPEGVAEADTVVGRAVWSTNTLTVRGCNGSCSVSGLLLLCRAEPVLLLLLLLGTETAIPEGVSEADNAAGRPVWSTKTLTIRGFNRVCSLCGPLLLCRAALLLLLLLGTEQAIPVGR